MQITHKQTNTHTQISKKTARAYVLHSTIESLLELLLIGAALDSQYILGQARKERREEPRAQKQETPQGTALSATLNPKP